MTEKVVWKPTPIMFIKAVIIYIYVYVCVCGGSGEKFVTNYFQSYYNCLLKRLHRPNHRIHS